MVVWDGGAAASIASHSLVQKLYRLTSFAGRVPGAGGAPCRGDLPARSASFLASGASAARGGDERAGAASGEVEDEGAVVGAARAAEGEGEVEDGGTVVGA